MSFVFILCWSVLGVACNDRSGTTLAWLLTINQIPLPMGCNGGIVYSCSLKPALPLFGHVMEPARTHLPANASREQPREGQILPSLGLSPLQPVTGTANGFKSASLIYVLGLVSSSPTSLM